MISFILIAIVLTLFCKRNPLNVIRNVQFKSPYLILLALGLQIVIVFSGALLNSARIPLLLLSAFAAFLFLWRNKDLKGLLFVLSGFVLNISAILLNQGEMPVSAKAAELAGVRAPIADNLRHELFEHSSLWWLYDWIPFIHTVLSPGDVLVAIGISYFWIVNSKERRGEHEA